MKKVFISLLLFVSGVIFSACGTDSTQTTDTAAESNKIQAVATFYPMYEFTKEVIGDEGEVELLISAGTEPHDYEPSAKDMAKIAEADVFVYNSTQLETWAENITDTVDEEKTVIIEAAKNIDLMEATEDEEEEHEEEGHDHELDPHVWLDPVLAIKEVETIRDALIKKYPEKETVFSENAQAYIDKLTKLDQEYTDSFAGAANKTFVTQHAAFGYLAKQYGLTQEAISGISPDEEPTPSRLAELKDYVEKNKIEIIYFEENASSKVAETLANETGVRLLVLNPLESLTEDQIKDGESYLSVMEENLAALKETIK